MAGLILAQGSGVLGLATAYKRHRRQVKSSTQSLLVNPHIVGVARYSCHRDLKLEFHHKSSHVRTPCAPAYVQCDTISDRGCKPRPRNAEMMVQCAQGRQAPALADKSTTPHATAYPPNIEGAFESFCFLFFCHAR